MTFSRAFAAFVGPLILGLAALPAQAQSGPRVLIGPNAGVYLPTSARAKDAFGSTFVNFGVGLGRVQSPGKPAPSFDFALIANRNIFSGGDRRAILVPVGISYAGRLKPLPKDAPVPTGGFTPYAGVSANLVLNNIRSDNDNIDAKWRYTGGGSVFVGGTLGENFFVQARYFGIGSIKGLNLSGLNLSTGVRF